MMTLKKSQNKLAISLAFIIMGCITMGFFDPTKPPEKESKPKNNLSLKAIVVTGKNDEIRRALIGQKWVEVGEQISGYLVKDITQKQVHLERLNRKKTLHLVEIYKPKLPRVKQKTSNKRMEPYIHKEETKEEKNPEENDKPEESNKKENDVEKHAEQPANKDHKK